MARRLWPLLFPLTYMVHIAEEYYGGFPQWAARYLRFQLTTQAFLELNMIAWTIMLCASLLAIRFASLLWLTVPFAAATLINGCAHAIASAITVSYSPGVVSGLSLWVPLGIVTLRWSYRHVSHRVFWSAVGFGVMLHLAITLTALES